MPEGFVLFYYRNKTLSSEGFQWRCGDLTPQKEGFVKPSGGFAKPSIFQEGFKNCPRVLFQIPRVFGN